ASPPSNRRAARVEQRAPGGRRHDRLADLLGTHILRQVPPRGRSHRTVPARSRLHRPGPQPPRVPRHPTTTPPPTRSHRAPRTSSCWSAPPAPRGTRRAPPPVPTAWRYTVTVSVTVSVTG